MAIVQSHHAETFHREPNSRFDGARLLGFIVVALLGVSLVGLSFPYVQAEWFKWFRGTFITAVYGIWLVFSFLETRPGVAETRGEAQYRTWLGETGGFFRNYYLIGGLVGVVTLGVARWGTISLYPSDLILPFEPFVGTLVFSWIIWNALKRLPIDGLYELLETVAVFFVPFLLIVFLTPYILKKPAGTGYWSEILIAYGAATVFAGLLAVACRLGRRGIGEQWTALAAFLVVSAVFVMWWGVDALELTRWFDRSVLLFPSFGAFAFISIAKAERDGLTPWLTWLWRGYVIYVLFSLQLQFPEIRDMLPNPLQASEKWTLLAGTALPGFLATGLVLPTRPERQIGLASDYSQALPLENPPLPDGPRHP